MFQENLLKTTFLKNYRIKKFRSLYILHATEKIMMKNINNFFYH